MNRHTATLYFRKLREVIARGVAAETPSLSGEIKLDESYFGGHRKANASSKAKKTTSTASRNWLRRVFASLVVWNQIKRHLRRFNGIPKEQFPLFLKECEWRFNYRPTEKLFKVLLK